MISRMWCCKPLIGVVFAYAIAEPALSAGTVKPHDPPPAAAAIKPLNKTLKPTLAKPTAGTVSIRTEALDLATLEVSDFGDIDPPRH